jgi:hypothetical protein
VQGRKAQEYVDIERLPDAAMGHFEQILRDVQMASISNGNGLGKATSHPGSPPASVGLQA